MMSSSTCQGIYGVVLLPWVKVSQARAGGEFAHVTAAGILAVHTMLETALIPYNYRLLSTWDHIEIQWLLRRRWDGP